MDPEFVVVLITTPNQDVAQTIARLLVKNGLAACVNILPSIHSIYTWMEQVQEDTEILLIAKTRADLVEDRLIPAVKAVHPYEVPEIIALPILAGSKTYLDWIREVTH